MTSSDVIDRVVPYALVTKPAQVQFDGRAQLTRRTAVLVRIDTRDGVTGWGEAACFGGVPELTAATVNHLASLVIGKEVAPLDVKDFLLDQTRCYGPTGLAMAAISGLEIALWDALGHTAGMPVSTLLGAGQKAIQLYATLGFYQTESGEGSPDNLVGEIEALPSGRYAGTKIKVGRASFITDLKRIANARKALGRSRMLMIDANNALDPREALKFAESCEEHGVFFFEEPIPTRRYLDSANLRKQFPTAIAGYETDADFDSAMRYVESGSVDIIQPDAVWSGGIDETLRIARNAARFGVKFAPHNFGTHISLAANYHVLSAANNGNLLEVDTTGMPLVDFDQLGSSWVMTEEGLQMTGGSGLGVTVDDEWIRPLKVSR